MALHTGNHQNDTLRAVCYFAHGRVAKYCYAHVCPSVFEHIFGTTSSVSLEPHAQSLPIFLCVLPMAMARSSSGRVTKYQGEGAVLGVFLPH